MIKHKVWNIEASVDDLADAVADADWDEALDIITELGLDLSALENDILDEADDNVPA